MPMVYPLTEGRAMLPAMILRYDVATSSLGQVVVATSPEGICAILFGDGTEAPTMDLARRFPRAALHRAPGELAAELEAVVHLIAHPDQRATALKLDLQGTPFQCKVWQALQTIAPGSTTHYAALATTLGDPKASRAVAGACARNHLAVAIPCHRVVRANGDLAGYRWGLDRKRQLLARERAPRA